MTAARASFTRGAQKAVSSASDENLAAVRVRIVDEHVPEAAYYLSFYAVASQEEIVAGLPAAQRDPLDTVAPLRADERPILGKNDALAFVVLDLPQERLETASVEYRQTLLLIDINGDAVAAKMIRLLA